MCLLHGLRLPATLRTRNQDLYSNVQLNPVSLEKISSPGLAVVLGHGLGSKDPRTKDHHHDEMVKIIQTGSDSWEKVESVILYTARGHGRSSGWESSAETDLEQFTWRRLAEDMVGVANYMGYNQFVAGGSSMGSATAFYAALQYPELVKGLIMAKPPTGWKERENRKKFLLSSAKKLQDLEAVGEQYHKVLQGASLANFPPLEDVHLYHRVRCPVLILALRGDESHPESTAYNLARLIPHSVLHFANSYEEAEAQWPGIIQTFINSLAL